MIKEIISWVFIGFVLLSFLILPVAAVFQLFAEVLRYFLSDWYNTHLFFTRVDRQRMDFLWNNFEYFKRLSLRDKEIFERRVQKFVNMKNFEGRQGLEVTKEMETLVAAAAIQLTFGYPSVYFKRFHTIILYPEPYLSTITGNYHKGEVFSGGIVVLSWRNFLEGYLDPADGRNLGLHEMAHAFKLADAFRGDDRDFLVREDLFRFIALARREMQSIDEGAASLFRSYAATNDQEFFAVAVETFFEKSAAFRNAHPELYFALVKLLRQDPLTLAPAPSYLNTQAA